MFSVRRIDITDSYEMAKLMDRIDNARADEGEDKEDFDYQQWLRDCKADEDYDRINER